MATDPNFLIQGLLRGTGFGQTQGELRGQDIQNQQGQQNLQAGALQLQAARAAQAQEQQYQTDIGDYFKDPRPQKLAMLAAKYPQKADALKQVYSVQNDQQRQSALGVMGGLFNAADAGRADIVTKNLTNVRDAERAQGIDTSEVDGLLADLNSGDAAKVKSAVTMTKGFAQMHLAAINPDKFNETYGVLGRGGEDDKNHFSTTGNGDIYDQRTGAIAHAGTPKPKWVWDATGSRWLQEPGTGGGGQASGAGGSSAPLDPKAFYKSFVLPHEGGYAAHDANGAPVNHGINQSANPGVDVKNLSEDDAAQIFTDKYWNQSGAANLPPALAAVHADTYFINPARAQQFLKASGGDPGKYMALRQAWMGHLVQSDPDKYGKYQKAWSNRNRDLLNYSQQIGSGAQSPTPDGAPSQPGVVNVPRQGGTGGSADKVGPEFLATLPTGRQNLIKAILDGRAAAPRPGSKFGEQLAEDIAQTDPSVDVTTLPMRMKARQEFTGNGKAAQVMASLGRFAAHMNSAWENHLALGGANLGPLSGIAAGITQSFDPAHVKGYSQELEAIQGEFQKLSKNGAASETEAERLIGNAKPAQSEAGRAAALQAMAKLALAQYPQMINQWHSAFPDRPLPVDLSPGSMAALQNIISGGKKALPVSHNGEPYVPGGHHQASGASPVHVANAGDYARLPSGTHYIDPQGVPRVKK